ncbi:sensor histidine kinase [Oerskovia jenensis]|uniref:Two-component system sensor histidine kinase DesK n=1 Tax=Oerskovia jenensis TaxID=162169 RepID=A0ABS2LAV8_9CELL|nr:histidine kinase [Oerskovia jenensis]MBM7477522.1 two-component system sensor histidine kinase DesK [Oerskovia jenensis]
MDARPSAPEVPTAPRERVTARPSPYRSPWGSRATRTSEASRRRFRRLNLLALLPVLALVGAYLVAVQAQDAVQAVVLALGTAAALLAFERWTAADLVRVQVPCLVVAAAVWPYGVLVVEPGPEAAYYGLAIVGSLVVPELSRHRAAAAVGVAGYVAAVGVWGLVASGKVDAAGLVAYVLVPTGITVVLIGMRYPHKGFYDVMTELEEAREREAELAVVRERMRFASDLHDIQGHTLHVVKLKIALAQKLVRTDTSAAERELRETYALVGDTIAQAKELAYGQRRPNLSAELENARRLLEAAGIRVRVDRPAELGAHFGDLLAQVLRETTTNVLRHSRATFVHVLLTADGITVVNDGAPATSPTLHGLAVLARRVSEAGGELTVEVADGLFRTAATFSVPGQRTGPRSEGQGP